MNTDSHLGKLASLGSQELASGPILGIPNSKVGGELSDLLAQRNGFFAFESALLVRGAGGESGDLAAWNSPEGWRFLYGEVAEGIFFFAEDVFGGQYGLLGESVVSFDPETGDQSVVAYTLEEWAHQVLDDFELMTGYPLAKEWQKNFGALVPGERLVPKVPFVLGGDFGIDNLYALDSSLGMEVRGELAAQIRDLPDGAKISYRVID